MTEWTEPTFQSLWETFGASQEGPQSVFWGFYDYDSPLQMSFMYGKCRKVYEVYCDSLQTIIYCFAACGLIVQLRKRNFSSVLFVTAFLGGFMYFCLFEAKSVYVLPYFILLIPFSSIGLLNFCSSKRKPNRVCVKN